MVISVNKHSKIFLIEFIILLAIVFNSFVLNIFNQKIYMDIFWLAILILTTLLVGFEKDKHLNKTDTMQTIFIVSIVYLIACYVFGFFFGFVKSIYSMKILTMLSNVVPVFIFIVLQEMLRYDVVTKIKLKKDKVDFIAIGGMILTFVLFDFTTTFGDLEGVKSFGIFESIGLYILPSIAKHLLLTYMVYYSGYKTAIFYRIIFDVTDYILPVFPDFGSYMQSILDIVFPTIMYFILNKSFVKKKDIFVRQNKKVQMVGLLLTCSVMAVLVMLVSGIFKYYVLTVGSASMEPNLKIGDVVVVKKLNTDELATLEKGDILVFENNKVIIHRIYDIYEDGGEYSFQTKGDNNNDIDGFIVHADQVIGTSKIRIPWVGLPTVWLSELLKD